MLDDRPIVKAAWHEAAHATVAHSFHLEIEFIEIHPNGRGKVSYVKKDFYVAEIEVWLLATLAAGIVERQRWGSAADAGDLRAIEKMVHDYQITPWSDSILNGYRHAAGILVKQKLPVIEIVAEELLRVGRMTGTELEILLSPLSQGAS